MALAHDLVVRRGIAAAITGSGPANAGEWAAEWLLHATAGRVAVLLADRVATDSSRAAWPPEIAAHLSKLLGAAVLANAVRDAECARVFAALHLAGVHAIVFKGAALAHTIYRRPYLRQRVDTDILVAKPDLPSVDGTFAALGYSRPIETSGTLITQQSHFERTDACGIFHAWDVHWKVVNVHAVADSLTYADISRDGVAVPALGPVVAPSPPASLLLACLHRVAHHGDALDLCWLMDLHLLSGHLSSDDWRTFIELARARGIWTACAQSLARTREVFDTAVPSFVADALEDRPDDATRRLLDPALRQIDVVRADLAALPTWMARCQMLREHVFPPATFMVARYGVRRRATLPWWYVRRICAGGPKWLRRRRP
jgi:hypothetical protein